MDERYPSLPALLDAAIVFEEGLHERPFKLEDKEVFVTDTGDLYLRDKEQTHKQVRLTHKAFGQIASTLDYPATPLRSLAQLDGGPSVAADTLNLLIDSRRVSQRQALLHRNGTWDLLACTSDRYDRIPNSDVIALSQWINGNAGGDWSTPPSAPRSGAPPSYNPGDFGGEKTETNGGLYLSQSDCFIFQVSEDGYEVRPGEFIKRGYILSNDITGSKSLRLMGFSYDMVCGNHIIWGAKMLGEVRVRHTGDNSFDRFERTVRTALPGLAAPSLEEERTLQLAAKTRIASVAEELIESVASMTGLSKRKAEEGFEEAMTPEAVDQHGDPFTYWGMVSGLTRLARNIGHADERMQLDRAAAKILDHVKVPA
jgi:hypothetical protein